MQPLAKAADSPAMEKPWLEYDGQSSADLIAHADTHRVDSILCALEWAIQAKEAAEETLSREESILLSIMALDREVNNGGYDQFFTNSSQRYVPVIVEHLQVIGAADTAARTAKAIDVREDFDALDELDQQHYAGYEIEGKLWDFVSRHQDAIRVPAMPRPA